MKQIIINILLGILCIFLAAGCVFLYFKNLSLKEEIEGLNQRLSYEEQLLEEKKTELGEIKSQAEDKKNEPLVITSSDAEENAVADKKETETTPEKKTKKKNKAENTVDLSNMEEVPTQTVVPEKQIDMNNLDQYFNAYPISDALFEKIYGEKRSFKPDCSVPREALSYIKVLHYGFDGKIKVGEMIINKLLEEDVLYIFKTLFENKYQIEKMILVEKYAADDDESVNDNNTSCFNFRTATDSATLSNHATGCAIDINPLQNPYIRIQADGSYDWDNVDVDKYIDRTNDPAGRHMITYDDLCYKLFAERGFTWGGDWANPIDYQHFEKPVY